MIHLSGQLICTNEQEAVIVSRHLPEHIRLSRDEPGCLSFDVNQTTNPLIWQVDESFVDQAAFDAHQIRTRASEWFIETKNIQRQFKTWAA